jgi:hypothetical protein
MRTRMLNDSILLLVCLGAGFFVLINAIYAIKFPIDFLKAKWTVRRGMGLETSPKDVRSLGLIFVLLAAFCLWCSYVTILKIIEESRAL